MHFKSFCSALAAGLMLLVGTQAFAQRTIDVTGTVTDAKGEPIIGVGVLVPGTTIGDISDTDGKYKIHAVPTDATLTVSAIGYVTQQVPVQGRKVIDVVLAEDYLSLDDAVVIGYGTQRKGDITSAVASVKSEDFLKGNIGDAAQLVKGKVAGLTITKASGNPNAESTIRLRGVTTMVGDLDPLVLVDGLPGDLNTVAPENIADISVLKDASAAAIYGTRGANGVILITTKSGRREEKVKVNYSGYVSVSDWYKRQSFYTAADIAYDQTQLPKDRRTVFSDGGAQTDWLKEISRTGFTHNNALSIEGGAKNTTYAASIAYRGEEGVMKGTNNNELKMQFDVSQYLFNDILKINLNIVKGLHKNNVTGDTNLAYRNALIRNPTSPVYNEDGSYFEDLGRFQYYNPVALMNEVQGNAMNEWTNMAGNITLEPIKGWKTNLMLATHRTNSMTESYTTGKFWSLSQQGVKGSAYKGQSNSQKDYLELTSTYDANWGKHRFSALVGYSYQYEMYEGFSAGNSNFPTEAYLYNNLGTGSYLKGEDNKQASMGSNKSDSRLIGFFGRVSYGYDNRYNILVSLRHEGSSKFGANHKWANFPSVSAGWTISNESFMEGARNWLSNLKLRAGYGITGITPGSSYLSLAAYNYDTSYGNFRNTSGKWVGALVAIQNPNPELRWEKTSEINVGLDFGFLDNRISGSVDVYNKTTNDMLYWYSVPVPPNIYGTTLANVGSIRNTGVEVMINAVPVRTRNFEWSTTITGSHNKAILVSLSNDLYETDSSMNMGGISDPVSVSTHRVVVGEEIGRFWGLKSLGVNGQGKWVIEDPATKLPLVYSTALNDDAYRQYLGTGMPQLYLNWGNTFRYRGFDLNIQMSSQLFFYILNNQRLFYENNSIAYNRLTTSTRQFPVIDLRKSTESVVYSGATKTLSPSQQQAFVSEYLERGDYLKIDNITFGYTFNTEKVAKVIKSARLYVSGNNLLCITGYTGLDPEMQNADPYAAGIDDRDKYPTIRSFTFGVNLTF